MNPIPLPLMEVAAADPAVGWAGAAALMFALVIGHAVADYPLQGSFLASAKNRHLDPTDLFGETSPPRGLWIHALTAHSLIHAGAVWLVTGSLLLGSVELVLHWLIDFIRCEKKIGYTTDQMLHVACKAAYAVVIAFGLSG
jgi:hypothetical protein